MLKTFIIIDLILIFFFSNLYIENKQEFEQVHEIIKLSSDLENNQNVEEILKKLDELQKNQKVQELIKLANDNFINNSKFQELIKTISENNSINQENIQEIIKLSSSENVEEITNQENNEQYKLTLQELLRQIDEASLSTHN